MQRIAVLALPGVIPSDLGIACDVFRYVRNRNGDDAYTVEVCSEANKVDTGLFSLSAPYRLGRLTQADIVVVPGVQDISAAPSAAVVRAIRAAHARGALVASICTGAFVLAAAGLLDRRRAATHWAAAEDLARRYPQVMVDADALFVDHGDVVTSAGSSAGLDMCLHLIARQHGQAIAAQAAKLAVAPLRRDGGQAPFIRQQPLVAPTTFAALLEWMHHNLRNPIDVRALAERAHMTPRTFARKFKDQTGTTPIQWLLTHRIRMAQELLETTAISIDDVAAAAGFESSVTFRARFQRVVGLTPTAYRRRFSSPQEGSPSQASTRAANRLRIKTGRTDHHRAPAPARSPCRLRE